MQLPLRFVSKLKKYEGESIKVSVGGEVGEKMQWEVKMGEEVQILGVYLIVHMGSLNTIAALRL
jgi:hypothetical protein